MHFFVFLSFLFLFFFVRAPNMSSTLWTNFSVHNTVSSTVGTGLRGRSLDLIHLAWLKLCTHEEQWEIVVPWHRYLIIILFHLTKFNWALNMGYGLFKHWGKTYEQNRQKPSLVKLVFWGAGIHTKQQIW